MQKDRASGCYELGPMAIRLGVSALLGLKPVKLASAELPGFAREIDHTVSLAVWGNKGPAIVQIEESSHPIHVDMRLGTVMSILGSATGRVFAACLPEGKVRAAVAEQKPKTEEGLLRYEALRPELEKIAASGIALARGLAIPWINSMSAAVYDYTGSICMAVTTLGPAGDFDAAPDSALARALLDFAARLSEQNGYIRPGC
ncbi:MAG: IclR family transcriptional regulator [Candidatus Protistobacter heckmanni]|nr:IclR family transcriptional regulator [Candidatus Protistobacter heckmanni]